MDVSALLVPSVGVAHGRGDFVPLGILPGEIRVELAKNFGLERRGHRLTDFVQTRPQVAQENVRAFAVLADGVVGQVQVHASGQRERHHQRRRHEEIRLDVLMDARLEIAVAAEHRRRDQVVRGDGFLDLRMQRAGVADARRAAVADDLEAELVEVGLQPAFVQVIRDDARAGSQRGLYRRIDAQTAFDRLFRQQARAEHDAGVGRVRATGDRRDEHAAVTHFGITSLKFRLVRFGNQHGGG